MKEMITVGFSPLDSKLFLNQYSLGNTEKEIVRILSSGTENYQYTSIKELRFEIALRSSTVRAAQELAKSKMSFRSFDKAKCNADFWKLSSAGGFVLKDSVQAADAVMDIYRSSAKYATECATAVVIVYLKAVIDVLSKEAYDKLFANLYLFSWDHLDPDLGIHEIIDAKELIPGDCRYFKNPEYSNKSSEWQGENTIYLGFGYFYGHGIGIATQSQMISRLNFHRRNNSSLSAYLTESATCPDFKYLAKWQK